MDSWLPFRRSAALLADFPGNQHAAARVLRGDTSSAERVCSPSCDRSASEVGTQFAWAPSISLQPRSSGWIYCLRTYHDDLLPQPDHSLLWNHQEPAKLNAALYRFLLTNSTRELQCPEF